MAEPLSTDPVMVEHVPVPRKALDDLQAALRFLEWAETQGVGGGATPTRLASQWLQSIGKEIFRG